MTDVNANNTSTKEVTLFDEDGNHHNDANPVPVKTVTSVLSTVLASILAAVIVIETTIGLVYADLQNKADWIENQRVSIYDSTNTIPADVVDYEGDRSLGVFIAYQLTYTVSFSVDAASGTTGYMLVDLSDTTNWPHTNTGHIVLKSITVDTNTDAAFVGDLRFGFLSNVDATNGDFHEIGELHGERSATVGSGAFDFSNYGIGLETDEWFGVTTPNNVLWQTDVNLLGPDGLTTHPSGDGDFVMVLESTAGSADISITVIYTTAE